MLTDTHSHLDFPAFAEDFADVLARAEAAGVRRIITIGTSLEGSRRAIALAERHPNVFAAIGVHPTSADEAPSDLISPLRELAQHPRVVAIGECGLDYYRMPSAEMRARPFNNDALRAIGFVSTELPGEGQADFFDAQYKARQAEVFEQQLDLAAELGLNVVIHQRASWEDTLAILKNYTGKVCAVFHCFGEGPERAGEVLALGHLVSFTGVVTFKNAQAVQATAASIPAEAFMLETDCPFLAPAPHRGKRCEPAHTRLVAERVAALRGVPLEELAAQTERTAEAFFRFDRS
jgi:TatD DNase family protein